MGCIHHHHHHLLATFKLNYSINNFVRARRPPRTHKAYRGGHLFNLMRS